MSWADRWSMKTIRYLQNRYKIRTYIETGTFKGIGVRFHSYNFKEILTCEINPDYIEIAKQKLASYPNVHIYYRDSPEFLNDFKIEYNKQKRDDIVFIYLDAHFYNPNLPKDERFIISRELKALAGFKNCIICIHDFDNNLGHITYDGISLDLELVQKDLLNINPCFCLYTNELKSCDIISIDDVSSIQGLISDSDTLDNLQFVHSVPRLTYRGILYAVPDVLSSDELRRLGLKKIKVI